MTIDLLSLLLFDFVFLFLPTLCIDVLNYLRLEFPHPMHLLLPFLFVVSQLSIKYQFS